MLSILLEIEAGKTYSSSVSPETSFYETESELWIKLHKNSGLLITHKMLWGNLYKD